MNKHNSTCQGWQWACAAMGLVLMMVTSVTVSHAEGTNPSPYKSSKLANGLDVVVVENHTVPLATIAIAVRNGAFTEPDEFAGLSHLYEHMFFKANTALPSQEQFMARCRALGIIFNGYTSEEVVVYFFTLPTKNLEPGMKFMADAIMTPMFKQTELEREREVVLGEFDRNEADPSFPLRYALDSAVWMPYVSRKQPLGQRPVIKTATVEKMKMIQDRYYLPNNSALIVSGDVKSNEVSALAEKYLSGWKRGADPFPTYNPPAFPVVKSKLVVREVKQPAIQTFMVFHGPSIDPKSKDWYTGELVSTLCGMDISRFQKNLVDSGLALSAFFGYDATRNVSDPQFYMTTTEPTSKLAYATMKREIKLMAKPGYFTAEEIEIAKHIIADRLLFEQDNPQGFAIGSTARWWSKGSLDLYLTFPSNVNKLTEKDIVEYMNKYIVNQPFVLGVGADAETLKKLNTTEDALQW